MASSMSSIGAQLRQPRVADVGVAGGAGAGAAAFGNDSVHVVVDRSLHDGGALFHVDFAPAAVDVVVDALPPASRADAASGPAPLPLRRHVSVQKPARSRQPACSGRSGASAMTCLLESLDRIGLLAELQIGDAEHDLRLLRVTNPALLQAPRSARLPPCRTGRSWNTPCRGQRRPGPVADFCASFSIAGSDCSILRRRRLGLVQSAAVAIGARLVGRIEDLGRGKPASMTLLASPGKPASSSISVISTILVGIVQDTDLTCQAIEIQLHAVGVLLPHARAEQKIPVLGLRVVAAPASRASRWQPAVSPMLCCELRTSCSQFSSTGLPACSALLMAPCMMEMAFL